MQLEVTQAAKEHIIKLGYDVAYGARPLRRVIQNMIEDVLAEHLLLGQYEPGTTIVVDKDPEAGLDIHAAETRTPGRGRLIRAAQPGVTRRRRGPEPLRLPVLRRVVPPLGRAVPRLRRVEQPRRDGRPRATRVRKPRAPGAGIGSRRADRPRRGRRADRRRAGPIGHRRAGPRPRRRARPGLARPRRRRAGHRQVDAPAPGRRRASPRPAARAVLYATGEESAAQVRLRAARLGLLDGAARDGDPRRRRGATSGGSSRSPATSGRQLVVVDSIQTATVDELDGAAGSVGQVRESALRLMELAKGEGIAVVLVGHVTKDGSLAGPKTLEHLVDAVLDARGRAVRARCGSSGPPKNRFGSTEEVGRLRDGRAPACARSPTRPARSSPSTTDRRPGSVVAPTLEGSRPILVEVQALVAPAGYGHARRARRAASTRTGSRCSSPSSAGGPGSGSASHDVYANLAGGLSVGEPGLDLPIALALASSLRDRPVRDRHGGDRRGRAARRAAARGRPRTAPARGRPARVPIARSCRGRPAARPPPTVPGIEIVAVGTLREAIGGGPRATRPSAWRARRRAMLG